MAKIKPFAALRYDVSKAGDIADLTCPPYDVIDEQLRHTLLEKSCYNMVRLELPEGDRPYCHAAQTFNDWLSAGILKRDMDEGIYIFEEDFKDKYGSNKTRRGFFCLIKLEEPASGIVLPHENTLDEAKEDRYQLLCATGCGFSPIFALYRDNNGVTKKRLDYLSKTCAPRYDFSAAGVHHRMWVINDPIAIGAVRDDFTDRKLFIADGHHRYETALRYRDKKHAKGEYCPGAEYIMAALVDMDDPGLTVYPTHRAVKKTDTFNESALLAACRENFDIISVGSKAEAEAALQRYYEENRCVFGMYTGENRYVLLLKENISTSLLPMDKSEAYRSLDVTVLHSLILEPVFKINTESMATGDKLLYTRSFEEAEALVESNSCCCCFTLNPTRVTDIAAVAAEGEKMPQKSTYFYPKLTTGLVINKLD